MCLLLRTFAALKPMVQPVRLPASLKYFMAVACGIVVANLYYCQPLLGRLADAFSVGETAASWINICCQMGYGLGLLLLVPLGDMMSRRRLLCGMQLAAALVLCGAALSTQIGWLYFFSLAIGVATTACQVYIPLSAHLSSDEQRGKVIGTLMGGLLTGILLSRTLSGFIADLWGWRSMYWVAAGMMVILAMITLRMIPEEEPEFKGSYGGLMHSLLDLLRSQAAVRQSAWMGACLFGALSVFWSTMAFYLEKPPFSYRLSVIGLFGFAGLAGALVSPWVGRASDRIGPLRPMRWGLVAMLAGYLILFKSSNSLYFLLVGIVLIDVGMQAAHVPNLTRVSSLVEGARTRLNTIYMTSFFIGGTLGSVLGSYAWSFAGWMGVCLAGLLMVVLGAVPFFSMQKLANRTA